MKIPKKITIIGRVYEIQYSKTIGPQDNEGANIKIDKGLITMQESIPGNIINKDAQKIYFLHECCHAIFTAIDRKDLSDDERLVTQLAEVLYQFIPQLEGK